jgi:recombination associated protein RdgC
MDLVDIIVEKRFLGQEFLTWLWYKSEERGGTVDIPGMGDVSVVFEKHMLLESGEGDSREKVICQGLQAELTEARTGLRMGKKLEQARILLGRGEYQWNLTIRASLFDLTSVKVPKTMTTSEESDAPEAVEGRLIEKISLFEEAMQLIDELFRMYLQVRLSNNWERELPKVRAWIKAGV